MVLDIAQIKQDINLWIENFVEVPHPALGGWPPCPYARQARINKTFDILLGHNLLGDLENRAKLGMSQQEVIIYVYDPATQPLAQFDQSIQTACQDFLLPRGLIALADHPADPEIVNGICMNQGTYALVLVQSLPELNTRAAQIAAKGFYHNWPEDYLQTLFQHRKDPR